MPRPTLLRRAAAEGVGTFALVFAGCGAIITDDQRDGALGVVGVGLVFFLVLLAAIAALGHISGAHFNPGVSLSFFLTRHLPAARPPRLLVRAGRRRHARRPRAARGLARPPRRPRRHRPEHRRRARPPAGGPADRPPHARDHERRDRHAGRRRPAALAIGAAVGLAAIAFGPLTGASLNTARSLGPAVASGQWHDFWIYVAGPLIGAPLGALTYEVVRGERPQAPALQARPGAAQPDPPRPDGRGLNAARREGPFPPLPPVDSPQARA